MKIVQYTKTKINRKELSEKLGMDILSIKDAGDYLKLLSNKGIVIYLRCDDIKQLLGTNLNIFDEDQVKITKDEIIFCHTKETYRGSVNKFLRNR
jgi:hypothetical protein